MIERSDGSQWLFISGLVLGLAGNLVISALGPDPKPGNWKRLLIGGGSFILASAFFSVQGWTLQRLEQIARAQDEPSRKVYADVKRRLVNASLSRLVTVALLGLCFTIGGVLCIARVLV